MEPPGLIREKGWDIFQTLISGQGRLLENWLLEGLYHQSITKVKFQENKEVHLLHFFKKFNFFCPLLAYLDSSLYLQSKFSQNVIVNVCVAYLEQAVAIW